MHKSGFVSIVGKPNAGKSTLTNAFLQQKVCSTTPKAQTTRHQIKVILNEENSQLILLDTPGIIVDPIHALHKKMNNAISNALQSADIILFLRDIHDEDEEFSFLKTVLLKPNAPIVFVLNKIDTHTEEEVKEWKEKHSEIISKCTAFFEVSALKNEKVKQLLESLVSMLPVSPPYFDKNEDEVSDLPVRFFIREIIRERIFFLFKKEVPYCSEVVVTEFREKKTLSKISVSIFVERDSQKAIFLGKNGTAIKKLGTQARKNIESFINRKVFLDITVKVKKKWRQSEDMLRSFGY